MQRTENPQKVVQFHSAPQDNGAVAQLVERGPEEPGVGGSSPPGSAKFGKFQKAMYICKRILLTSSLTEVVVRKICLYYI